MAKLTVSFKGKLAPNGSVKVPKIGNQHINLRGNEDLTTVLFVGSLNDERITSARLKAMRYAKTGDNYWPGSVDIHDDGFKIEPIGNGFMANVSIELDTDDMRFKG